MYDIFMLANHEHRIYSDNAKVWVGRYRNLRNISHWHFDHELVVSETGRATIIVNQTAYTIDKGQCLYIHGQAIHSIDADNDTTLYVALFSEKLLERITDSYCLLAPLFNDTYQALETLKAIRKTDFERGLFYDEKCNNMMRQLITEIFTHEEITAHSFSQSKAMENYKNLLYDIDEHIEEYSFERGAEFMHMSDAYFSRFFKKNAGMTFSEYLNHIRINKAIDLLHEQKYPVTEISSLCGFDTIRNFNRVFRNITGYAPKQLPKNYILHLRSNSDNNAVFDPTISTSELMIE